MFPATVTSLFQRRTAFVLLVRYPLTAIALFAVWWFFGWFYLTVAIVFVALMFILIAVPAKNVVNIAQGNWRRYIETLLFYGYDRAFMMVEAPSGKQPWRFGKWFGNLTVLYEAPARTHFMQFTKHITESGVILQLQFAHAPWSARYYQPLQDLLKQREYYFDIWPVRPEDKFGPEIDEFIVIALEQDVQRAIILIKLILLDIFKLNPSDNASVWFGNIGSSKRKIGF